MQQEHSHIGDPSYLAYTGLKCRHTDCYAAYIEYKERLAERKAAGIFRDLRLRENRQEAIIAQFIERLQNDPELARLFIPVLAGTVVTEVATDAREVQAEPQSEPAPTTDTPVVEKPLQVLPAAPVTLLGCLAELAADDGTFTRAKFVAHSPEICKVLGIETLQLVQQISDLMMGGHVKILGADGYKIADMAAA